MTEDQFLDMLPKTFWIKVDGFYEFYNLKEKNEWIRFRWQTTLLLNIHLPKNKMLKEKDLITFDWEKIKKIDFKDLKMKAEYIKKLEDHGK